jgi:5-methylcytosine-specific restriction endonuclease McrA
MPNKRNTQAIKLKLRERKEREKLKRAIKRAKARRVKFTRLIRKATLSQTRAMKQARNAFKRALAAWAREALAEFGGVCAVCGAGSSKFIVKKGKQQGKERTAGLHIHHVLPREVYPEFALEPSNRVVFCPEHHKYGVFSAHRNPIWFAAWLQEKYPLRYMWAVEHLGTLETHQRVSKTSIIEIMARSLLAQNQLAIAAMNETLATDPKLQIPTKPRKEFVDGRRSAASADAAAVVDSSDPAQAEGADPDPASTRLDQPSPASRSSVQLPDEFA